MLINIIKKYISEQKHYSLLETIQQITSNQSFFFEREFAQVNKYISKNVSVWDKDDQVCFSQESNEIFFHYWSLCDIIRAQLLNAVHNWEKDRYVQVVENCYKRGDNREQCSILKSLSLLNYPQYFCRIAHNAVRTNIPNILASLACGNPYPRKYFSDHEFNNMVLKCIFMGIPVSQILLKKQLDPDLVRMVNEYIDEREAAKRDIPKDIWVVAYGLSKESYLKRMYCYLENGDEDHRYWIITAISRTNDERHIAKLQEQAKRESSEKLRILIEKTINKIKE